MALGVMGKDVKVGVEVGTQIWTETCPWACIDLLPTEIHFQELGNALRESQRREDGANLGLHSWTTYLGLRISKAGNTT